MLSEEVYLGQFSKDRLAAMSQEQVEQALAWAKERRRGKANHLFCLPPALKLAQTNPVRFRTEDHGPQFSPAHSLSDKGVIHSREFGGLSVRE